MTGLYTEPTDGYAITYSDQVQPALFRQNDTSSFEIFGYAAPLQSFSHDMANEVLYKLIGGTKSVEITDRRPSGEVVIEAPTIAQKNFFSAATGTSTGSLNFTHGTVAGNIVDFSSPQADIGAPSYSDQDGIQMMTLPYMSTPTTAGNDEMSLVLT